MSYNNNNNNQGQSTDPSKKFTYSNIKPNNVLFTPIKADCVIFVGGFDELVNEEILFNTCIPFGNITQLLIPVNPFSNEVHRGFGFVEFETKSDALDAIDNLHQSELFGKVLKVTVSKSIHMREGSTKAIWEEEDWIAEHGNKMGDSSNNKQATNNNNNGDNEAQA